MENYDDSVEAINGLRKEGHTEDFNLKQNCIKCRNGKYKIFYDEFYIENIFVLKAILTPAMKVFYTQFPPANTS